MDLKDAGKELPNDPDDNPCFCCRPRNPIGLRMRFFDDGEIVRSTLTLDERARRAPSTTAVARVGA